MLSSTALSFMLTVTGTLKLCEFFSCLLPNLWLVLKYCSLLVIVTGSNGGGDHPMTCCSEEDTVATGVAGTVYLHILCEETLLP